MLFGHQDNSRLAAAGAGGSAGIDPSGTAGLPSIPDNFEPDTGNTPASALNQGTGGMPTITPANFDSVTAATDSSPRPAINTIVPPTPPTPTAPTSLPTSGADPAKEADTKPFDVDLLSLKQQALAQLEPLVDHLDQTPEEKFRTTMMLIQSADNQALIKVAYEAAQHIPDEKVKAQALLDVVNEINYFAQKEKNNS